MGSLGSLVSVTPQVALRPGGVSFYIGVIYIKNRWKKIKDMCHCAKPGCTDWWAGSLEGLELGCVGKGTECSDITSKGPLRPDRWEPQRLPFQWGWK